MYVVHRLIIMIRIIDLRCNPLCVFGVDLCTERAFEDLLAAAADHPDGESGAAAGRSARGGLRRGLAYAPGGRDAAALDAEARGAARQADLVEDGLQRP